MKDLTSYINPKRCISPVVVSDNTAQVGQIIDKQGFESLTYIIASGTLVSATASFTVLLEEGSLANMSDATTVAAVDMIGTPAQASFIFSDDDKVRKIGYIGGKRYTRLTITPATNAAAAPIAVIALLGNAMINPQPAIPV